ncbi:serine palmitoyltransferase small subunit B isoform X1 [Silurus meridionalis]|uniref:serine palmitoyltransferase small subunit B isoform X1 n=1 Tax=Silurus meridionalis TaxID=175797 RepID=UPI001EEB61CB|nr:serine palmitoyltransferase small subunit B isoform X1 [Silurus meridionalis]
MSACVSVCVRSGVCVFTCEGLAECQPAFGKDQTKSMDVKNMREYMGWLYYQYLLITGIYVLEPWEKSIFNTVLFTMVAMVVYTSYVFVPIHVRLALEFFSGLCGEQPESTVALMS